MNYASVLFFLMLCYSLICPQLEGRAPVASSVVVMGPASQENTIVTVWRTAQMGLTRETAVSLPQGGSLFLNSSQASVAF